MRVGISVGSLRPEDGGPSRTVPALAHALAEFGVDSEIVTGETAGEDAAQRAGLRVHPVRYASRRMRAVWGRPFRRRLLEVSRGHDVAIIHDNGVWLQSNHAAADVARALGLPLIISPRGMLEPWSLQHRAWKKRIAWQAFQRRDLRSAMVLHATSAQEAENLRALGLRQPIAVIGNGTDTSGALPSRTSRPLRTALFLSRIHPKKGLLDLVGAWSDVRPHGWRMVIAGPDEGGHRREVESAVRAAGLEDCFSFIGPVEGDAKRACFRDADLFVIPSYSENFGVVVSEALASGLPVIATTAMPWSVLRDERCGWHIPPGRTSVAESLRAATSMSDDERFAMGARGWALARAHLSWTRVAEQMAAVYEWMLHQGPAPDSIVLD